MRRRAAKIDRHSIQNSAYGLVAYLEKKHPYRVLFYFGKCCLSLSARTYTAMSDSAQSNIRHSFSLSSVWAVASRPACKRGGALRRYFTRRAQVAAPLWGTIAYSGSQAVISLVGHGLRRLPGRVKLSRSPGRMCSASAML